MHQFEKDGVELRNAIERIERQLASPAYIEGLRDQEFWFDNLVENGTFDLGITGWAATNGNAALSHQAGEFRVENASNNLGEAYQVIPLQGGVSYEIGATVTAINDVEAQFYLSTTASYSGTLVGGGKHTSTGAKSFTVDVASTGDYYLVLGHRGANTAGKYAQYDNFYAYQTDGTNIIHRMPTGWKPRRVFIDGILQREGATHDYEIKQDSEGYYIVPAVAPGANTETCILGVRT